MHLIGRHFLDERKQRGPVPRGIRVSIPTGDNCPTGRLSRTPPASASSLPGTQSPAATDCNSARGTWSIHRPLRCSITCRTCYCRASATWATSPACWRSTSGPATLTRARRCSGESRANAGTRPPSLTKEIALTQESGSFPDSPLRGAYPRSIVYAGVTGWESFEPWLSRIQGLDERALWVCAEALPPEWYCGDREALERLLETLMKRRTKVRDLIAQFRRSSPESFPEWR